MSTRLSPRVNHIDTAHRLRREQEPFRAPWYRDSVPDDERTRRRLSDATKGRIADLASGWTVDADPATPEPVPPTPTAKATPAPAPPALAPGDPATGAPRKKQRTLPPPPPGSEARKALESAILDSKAQTPVPTPIAPSPTAQSAAPPPPPRTKPPTAPPSPAARVKSSTLPPQVPARIKPPTAPPPIPPAATKSTGPRAAIAPGTSAQSKSGSMTPVPATGPAVGPYATGPVPTGEFDHGETNVEPEKLRHAHAQATIKRDASSALLGIPEQPLTTVKEPPVEMLLTESAAQLTRDDATSIDPQTQKFERGDPTNMSRPDITLGSAPPVARQGRLRTVAQLRRQRGIWGDVRYVATAVFGVRRSRKELVELEEKQAARETERRRYMVTLGRTAITSDGFDHPALGPAREQLGSVEDERARHAGQVVASDQELQRTKRDRDEAAKQYVKDLANVDAEIAELDKRLEPLKKEHIAASKKGAELREQLRRIETEIRDTTAKLVSVKGPKQDPAAIQAELATRKADRIAVQRDEPKIAAELDALNPRIAALESKRSESVKRRAELVKAEEADKHRVEELLVAIGAKRKVMDRAASDAEALRDKILFELGERLYVDRPGDLTPQLSPIDSIDMELGEADRRAMELKEILSTIDKAKLARGIAVIVLVLGAVGGFVGWLIYMLA